MSKDYEYLKKWREKNPDYNREYMRRMRKEGRDGWYNKIKEERRIREDERNKIRERLQSKRKHL